MTDFLDRIAAPELLEIEREITALREALHLLIEAAERGYITQGDINEARATLASPSRSPALAERGKLLVWIENVATDSQLDQPVPALGGFTGRQLLASLAGADSRPR